MNNDTTLYMTQLKTISICEGSNAYHKKWAQLWLKEIQYQSELINRSRKTLIRLNISTLSNSNPRNHTEPAAVTVNT